MVAAGRVAYFFRVLGTALALAALVISFLVAAFRQMQAFCWRRHGVLCGDDRIVDLA